MQKRSFWQKKLEYLLDEYRLIWLSGVRRVGKTTLCRSLANVEYFDCESPRLRKELEDPEFFFGKLGKKTIILDEVHRLLNPSEVLKLAVDHFPHLKVIATGSSTLAAKNKFKDTLTGRKATLWMTPLIFEDMNDLQKVKIDARLLQGGLPSFYLSDALRDRDYAEWIDSFWAKDVQELFSIDKKTSFHKFFELLLSQSGELFEATAYAAPCEISRQTVFNYLNILETTLTAVVVPPWSGKKSNEIISTPKVYGFDTGFISYLNGWESIKEADIGKLWEHLILNELCAHIPRENICFWRDKQKHEIDFVFRKGRSKSRIHTVECKVNWNKFEDNNLQSFRSFYPEGENYVVSMNVEKPFQKRFKDQVVNFLGIRDFARLINEGKTSITSYAI